MILSTFGDSAVRSEEAHQPPQPVGWQARQKPVVKIPVLWSRPVFSRTNAGWDFDWRPNATPPRLRSSDDSAKPVLDYLGCLSSGIAEIVEFDCISLLSGLAFSAG